MENHVESDQLDRDSAYLFKAADIFSFAAVLKKIRSEALGVQPQDNRIHDEEDQGRDAKPDTEYRKRMPEKEQNTKIYQYHGNSRKDYEGQKGNRLFHENSF
jgi:chromatin segregation and condensation protein Rec8/ScpA/Scc1 (kleisin family)